MSNKDKILVLERVTDSTVMLTEVFKGKQEFHRIITKSQFTALISDRHNNIYPTRSRLINYSSMYGAT